MRFQADSSAAAARAAKVPPLVLKACANKRTGALYVIGVGTKRKRCKSTERAVRFAPIAPVAPVVGMKGPGGAFLVDPFKTRVLDKTGKALP